jgi:hypothetical protein
VCVAMWVWPPSRVRCCATQPLDLCALCVRYKGRSRSDALLAERSLRLYMSAAVCAGDENRCCCCHSCKQLRSQLWRIYMFRWKTLLLLHSTSQQGKLYSTAMWEEFCHHNINKRSSLLVCAAIRLLIQFTAIKKTYSVSLLDAFEYL